MYALGILQKIANRFFLRNYKGCELFFSNKVINICLLSNYHILCTKFNLLILIKNNVIFITLEEIVVFGLGIIFLFPLSLLAYFLKLSKSDHSLFLFAVLEYRNIIFVVFVPVFFQ
jgi:hypothetical protein